METEAPILTKSKKMNQELENGDCGNKKVRCKTLRLNDDKYRTTFTKKYENRKKWVKPNKKEMHSFIPGTVIDVNVKDGDKVKKGDVLFLLEAMKMLNTIKADEDATIKKVYIQIGEKIPKGLLVLKFQ